MEIRVQNFRTVTVLKSINFRTKLTVCVVLILEHRKILKILTFYKPDNIPRPTFQLPDLLLVSAWQQTSETVKNYM